MKVLLFVTLLFLVNGVHCQEEEKAVGGEGEQDEVVEATLEEEDGFDDDGGDWREDIARLEEMLARLEEIYYRGNFQSRINAEKAPADPMPEDNHVEAKNPPTKKTPTILQGILQPKHQSSPHDIGLLARGPSGGNAGNCDDVFAEGNVQSGIYDITIAGRRIEVFCDLKENGQNWLVFQRRQSGEVDFFLDWRSYQQGFGNKHDDFWLGLDNLHQITSSGSYRLRIELEDWDGNTAYAEYNQFSVGPPTSNYRLTVQGYYGNAGDSLKYHNNLPFSTKDRVNDAWGGINCAVEGHGGWWYNACQQSNLNGEYLRGGQFSIAGITWYHWKRNRYSLKHVEMKMRPNN